MEPDKEHENRVLKIYSITWTIDF